MQFPDGPRLDLSFLSNRAQGAQLMHSCMSSLLATCAVKQKLGAVEVIVVTSKVWLQTTARILQTMDF